MAKKSQLKQIRLSCLAKNQEFKKSTKTSLSVDKMMKTAQRAFVVAIIIFIV